MVCQLSRVCVNVHTRAGMIRLARPKQQMGHLSHLQILLAQPLKKKKKKTLNKKRCAIQDWGCSIMTHVLCEHGPKRCTMPLTLAFQNVTIKYMRNEQ